MRKRPLWLRRFAAFCQRVGMPLAYQKSTDEEFIWTGKKLFTVRSDEENARCDDLCHELAHWQIAAPSRRRYKHFGFPRFTFKHESFEEDQALILGVAYEFQLGRSVKEAFRYSHYHYAFNRYHGIRDRTRALFEFLQTALYLQRQGYLKDGKPTSFINPGRR
jgi:hypothetical protein